MDHIATEDARTVEGHAPTGPTPAFLAGLAHAMHAALARERARIDQMVADDAQEHLERTRARAALEAAELRRLAEDDIRTIDDWAAREIKRIRREAGRRARERRADMDSYLHRHEEIIDTEIAGLETAVADYSASLAHFVERLIASGDPSEIARLADAVPTPPDLDEARARARARAVAVYDRADDAPPAKGITAAADASDTTSDPGVAVMDPEADGRREDLPLAVDPLQVPEDDPVASGSESATPDEAAASNGQPSGALRIFRAIVPWAAAAEAPQAKDSEARRA